MKDFKKKDFIGKEEVVTLTIVLSSIVLLFINIDSNIINVIMYSLVMIPLAILLGRGTSKISDYIGEKRGGLISATAGNLGKFCTFRSLISCAKAVHIFP